MTSLDGLYGLTSIGGNLSCGSEDKYESIPLQSFEGLNNLKSIQGDFITDGVSFQSLTNLESIGGDLIVRKRKFDGLDNLKTIGGNLILSYLSSCTGLNSITSIGNINATDVTIDSFENFCTNLTTISGDLYFERCDVKSFKGLNELTNIGGDFHFVSGCNNLISFDGLNNLQTIGGDFIIDQSKDYSTTAYFTSFESFKGLDNLKAINGKFYMNATKSSMNKLKTFEGLTNLNKIGGDFEIEASYNSLNSLQSLHGLDNLTEIGGNFIITDMSSSFTFSDGPRNLSTINGNFIIMTFTYSYPRISSMAGFAGLERINGNLEIKHISSFSGFDNLKYIGGDFRLLEGDTQGLSTLSTIGGSLIVGNKYSLIVSADINGLTGLRTINGNLSISEISSMTAINGVTQLQKIGGNIEISDNSKLEDISGFSGLTNCTNISITDSPNLYNFESLETAAKNMTGTWYVYGCGYNPTKYQMLNGESKPQE